MELFNATAVLPLCECFCNKICCCGACVTHPVIPHSKNGNSPEIGVFISHGIITMLTPKTQSIINISILVFLNLSIINPMPKLPIPPIYQMLKKTLIFLVSYYNVDL